MTRRNGTPRSLRKIFSVAIVVIGLLAAASAAALIATTSVLQRTTADVAAAVESVRLVEEAELRLLLHARARDLVLQREIESELDTALDSARRYVTSASEETVLQRVEASVAAYVTASRQPDSAAAEAAEAAAFAALEELVAINIDHTRIAYQKAVEWKHLANIIGIVLGMAIVVISVAMILWLRRGIRPLFLLADTVRRFGEGQRTARAVEQGPLELQEMSRRFNEMAESIATQRQAQIAFLGGVAHDLRTPLSALSMAVDLLDPKAPLPPEPQLRHTVEVIARQIHHLERMVGDFVDMSTIEGGKLELQVDSHDVGDIVRDAVELFSHTEAMRERFELSTPPKGCRTFCDDVRIGQAVTNLVSNAIKYSPKGAPIAVRVRAEARDVIIEVADHGAGIAREDHARIFEPFRRVGSTDMAAGAGLGLYNVKRIVEAHDGRIEVESVPRRGTTFRIYLPVTGRTAPVDHPALHASPQRS